jgi:XTP/dITP diphosphohydrolase
MPVPSGASEALEITMATSNLHKVEEANYVLKPFGVRLVARDIKGDEVQSFEPSVVAKASLEAAMKKFDGPLVVEDTGLFIDALNGFPGALAAYVHKSIGLQGILKLLEGVENRKAHFDAAVAYGAPPGRIWVFTGRVYGRISLKEAGSGGFGFDPLFVPEGFDKTFAEMSLEEKSKISHRALAFRRLGVWIARG